MITIDLSAELEARVCAAFGVDGVLERDATLDEVGARLVSYAQDIMVNVERQAAIAAAVASVDVAPLAACKVSAVAAVAEATLDVVTP